MDKIRLLIASEDSNSRQALAAIFRTDDLFEVLGGLTLKETIDKSIHSQPDVILIDIANGSMPKNKQDIGMIKNKCPCSLVIVMVLEERSSDLLELLEQGIDGLIPRNIMRGCLIKTIELICKADLLCMPSSIKRMMSFKLENSFKNNLTGINEFLTRREIEILQLMAQNHSNREIAKMLYISEPTVKTHVSRILRKLGQNNRSQAVLFSYKNGLVR